MTAFIVIFLAEWGDLTQILTANLAAHYHAPVSVGVGAVLAMWAVAALAVIGGKSVLRFVNIATVARGDGGGSRRAGWLRRLAGASLARAERRGPERGSGAPRSGAGVRSRGPERRGPERRGPERRRHCDQG